MIDSERDPLSNRIGATMGEFRLERLLGSGGMAAVYLGRRSSDGAVRAIKVLHPQVARDRNLRARFAQEVEAVSRLDHPSIVRIEDMGAAADGSPFMVMELLEGETLHDRLSKGLPPLEESLRLADTLLDALAVAHSGRIIHRDVKPDNLFLTPAGLKILDFGIAKVRRESIAHVDTKTGTALGTPSYMAQEQIKGIDVDHRADLFAAGAVLLKMVTGRKVHEEPDAQRRVLMMLTTPAPPTRSVAPQLSEGICTVIDRALAFEPAERYPDARTMQGDIRAILEGKDPPYAATAPPISTHGSASAAAPSLPLPASQTSSEPTAATRVGPPPVGPGAHAITDVGAAPPAGPAMPHRGHAPQAAPTDAAPAVKRALIPIVIVLSVLFGVLVVVLLSGL